MTAPVLTVLGRQVFSFFNADGTLRNPGEGAAVWASQMERLVMALIAEAQDLELPNLLIRYMITGGTANAITATPNLPVPAPGLALFSIIIAQVNTGNVTINGKPLLSASGQQLPAGALKPGTYLFLDDGTNFRLINEFGVQFLRATNTGGTNSITATTPTPVPAADAGALIALPITTQNTSSPVTVAFNGGAALTIIGVDGSPVSAGDLTPGTILAGYKVGTQFRVLFGPKGWAPLVRVVSDGVRRVLELYDWTGGQGAKPSATGYLSNSGLTATIGEAADIRGPQGPTGDGTGDVLAAMNLSDLADLQQAVENLEYAFAVGGPQLSIPNHMRRRYVDVGSYASLNDTLAADAAIAAAINDGVGRQVVFTNPYGGTRTYKLSAGLSFALSNIELIGGDGAVIDISELPGVNTNADPGINFSGTLETAINLASDAAKDAGTLSLSSVTGLDNDDWLFLQSDQIWWSTSVYGEWVQIKSISGTTVTLYKPTRYAYMTANNGRVSKANLVSNVKARGLRFVGAGNGATFHTGMQIRLGINGLFEDCHSEGCDYLGVVFNQSIAGRVQRGEFKWARLPGFSYGVGITRGCMDMVIDGVSGDDLRHVVTIGGSLGINHDIKVANGTGRNCRAAAFDSHPQADLVIFDNLTAHLSPGYGDEGFLFQAAGGSMGNLHISGKAARHGALYQPLGNEIGRMSIKNVQGRATSNLVFADITKNMEGLDIDTVIGHADTRLVSVQASAGAKLRRWSVSKAISIGELPLRGVHVVATGAGSEVTNGTISQCQLNMRAGGSGGLEAMYLQGTSSGIVEKASVTGNTAEGGNIPLRGVGTDYITTAANVLRGGSSANRSIAGSNNQLGTDITS